MSRSADGWSHDSVADAEDDDDEIIFDDEEDEFGLPRIASASKKPSKATGYPQPTPGGSGGGPGNLSSLGFGLGAGNRFRANSSDIAEERGPLYPATTKGDGKILRPQYKEILKGNQLKVLCGRCTNALRSCECASSHQPCGASDQCVAEGDGHVLESHLEDQQIQAHSADEHCVTLRAEKSGVVWST